MAVTLLRGELSSILYGEQTADKAIDNNLDTNSRTDHISKQWLKIYFDKPYTVKEVVIEKGVSSSSTTIYQVSVYNGEKETSCGNYTGYSGYYNHTQQCGSILGNSVKLQIVSEANTELDIYEINVQSSGEFLT